MTLPDPVLISDVSDAQANITYDTEAGTFRDAV